MGKTKKLQDSAFDCPARAEVIESVTIKEILKVLRSLGLDKLVVSWKFKM